jgi:two-component system sensor histidine kinase YesM
MKTNLDNLLNEYLKISEDFISNSPLTDYIENDYDPNTSYVEKFSDYTSVAEAYSVKYRFPYNSVNQISIYTTNNTILTDNVLFTTVDNTISTQQWYKDALDAKGANTIKRTYFKSKNEPVINIIREIRPLTYSRFTNVMVIEVNESTIYDLIKKEGINKRIYLIDDKNYIISTSERKYIGKSIFKIPGLEKIKFDEIDAKPLDIDNKKNIVLFEKFKTDNVFDNWKIITITSSESMLKNIRDIINYSVFICIVITAITIILVTLFSNKLTKRLTLLINNMSSIHSGKFEVFVDSEEKDEIGVLSKSFKNMMDRINSLINDVYISEMHVKDMEIKKKEAEINALQSQMNPHFLFNTMESIRMKLIKKNEHDIADDMEDFARLLRKSIEWSKDIITVRQEIELVETYLKVYKHRNSDKYEFYININESLYSHKIPKFSIQPIVENAIYHGIEMKEYKGKLQIYSQIDENNIRIIVEDDGLGIELKRLEVIRSQIYNEKSEDDKRSIGLRNVHQRLQLYYGEQYGIVLTSEKNVGTKVEVLLPIEIEKGDG